MGFESRTITTHVPSTRREVATDRMRLRSQRTLHRHLGTWLRGDERTRKGHHVQSSRRDIPADGGRTLSEVLTYFRTYVGGQIEKGLIESARPLYIS